jgi:hypothetical protein
MGTSQKAFDQVKSILGRLDRSIDQVRERRLGPDQPPARPAPAQPAGFTAAPAPVPPPPANAFTNQNQIIGTPAPAPSPSKWGRAQPIRPDQKVG